MLIRKLDSCSSMETKESTTIFKVLMLPWLAHGHIFPYYELAKRLAKRNFHIFFCSTPINLSSIKKSINGDLSDISMEFIEIHLPDNFPELPPHYHTTKGLPPNLVPNLMLAFEMSKISFSDIINTLKPDLLIYDCYQSWAPECANSLQQKIPSVHFITTGAATVSHFFHKSTYGWSESSQITYPFPEICVREHDKKKFQAQASSHSKLSGSGHFAITSLNVSHEIALIKSSRVIEGKYLDYLSSLTGKELLPVGPLVQEPVHVEEEDYLQIFNWLNMKNPSSTVFVSFGSECFLSKAEIEELAHGLELSGVNFIWVIRFQADESTKKMSEVVSEEFLERTRGRGIVLEGWAPQTKILQHPSTGGFVSHCGWGSVVEALYFGVPLIAMPMKFDQPTNAKLLVNLGAGKEILRDENGERKSEEIAKVIKEIIIEKETGEDFKKKARELSHKLRMEEEEVMEEAIDKLQMICFNSMQQKASRNK